MIAPGATELLLAGAQAVLTPAAFLALALCFGVGLCMGPHRGAKEHLLVASVVVLVVGLGLARTGLQPFTSTARFLVAGSFVFLVDLGRREATGHRSFAWPSALLLALACIFLRVPQQGPVLAALGGVWEHRVPFGSSFLYHLGSGLALAVGYLVAASIGARVVPRRWAGWTGVVAGLALALVAGAGLLAPLSRQLLLRWPVSLWG